MPDEKSAKPSVKKSPVDFFDQTTFDAIPDVAPEIDLEQLLEAGVHFGHQKAKWSPKMSPWIYMEKSGVHIFDLGKTAQQLRLAYNAAYMLGKQGKTMVFVATKKQAKDIVTEIAQDLKLQYVTSRWLGGMLTNWNQVKKSLARMNTIEEGLKGDAFKGYTKYERVQLEKELGRLRRFFEGVRDLKQRPDAFFIVDPNREEITVKEANVEQIPVIALTDSNTDPDPIQVVIPGNDDAQKSIRLITQMIAEGYALGRKEVAKK